MYVESIWYRWTYLQGRKRHTNVENRWQWRVGWIGRLGLTHVHCQAASGNLPCRAGSSALSSVVTWGGEGQRAGWEGGDLCTHTAESLTCTAETNTTVKRLYSNFFLSGYYHMTADSPWKAWLSHHRCFLKLSNWFLFFLNSWNLWTCVLPSEQMFSPGAF